MVNWFEAFARWNTTAWIVLFVYGFTLEMLGVFYPQHFSTFTAFIRDVTPVWVRLVALVVLGWHFEVINITNRFGKGL